MIDLLARRVQGPVIRPGDAGYNPERAGFQTAARHQPDMIVGATTPADVQAAVAFARDRGLPVAVQATGHQAAVGSTGGVLITTRRMSRVRVDPEARSAWLEAGVRWQQAIDEAAPHGLAPLSGSSPHVGAVAYTLGGGLGLLARRFGYAADYVRSIDVVTADARLHHLSAESDPDLFWALRGGRDNFGVVTGLDIALLPVTRLYGGGLYFDADPDGDTPAADVLGAYTDWAATVPDELSSSVGLIPLPDHSAVPEPLRGRYVAHVRIAYTGDAAAGERLVAPLRAIGPRLIERLGELPYTAGGSIYNDPAEPDAYDADNALLRDVDARVLHSIVELAGPHAPVPCVVQLRHLGGALARPPAGGNAVGHRKAKYLLSVLSPLAGIDAGAVRSIYRRLDEALAPGSLGRSLNYLYGVSTTADQVVTAYESDDYRRLTELKAVYDPANTFRLNHNIPPARDHR